MTDALPAPEDVLTALAALLGVNYLQHENRKKLHSNCALDWSYIPWEPCSNNNGTDQDGPDVNFSSFPSLSLERSREEPAATRETRKDVEAHVSALLSRPILVSSSDAPLVEYDDYDSTDFIAGKVSDVPGLVLDNFYKSFTTLMNSRLRAYAKFLARHGLALLKSAPSSAGELDEGVVGVEQKLETMLEIGRLVSTNAIVTSFLAKKEGMTRKEIDDETCEVSMPLVMDAAIDIFLPQPGGKGNEVVTVAFQTSGTITGIFSNSPKGSLLRVVGVDLDMSKLLKCMIEQAASVISCIIEMTNTTYSMALPPSLDAAQGVALESNLKKRKASPTWVEPDTAAVVSPPLQPKEQVLSCEVRDLCLEDDKEITELSAERCEYLLDLVLNETDHSVLESPSQKRMKIMTANGVATVPPPLC